MSTRLHDDVLDRASDLRRFERRRWFELVFMVPVSIGMLAVALGYVSHDVFGKFFDPANGSWPLPRFNEILAVTSAVLAVASSIISALWWRWR